MGSCRAMVFSYHSTALLQSMAECLTLCFGTLSLAVARSSNIQLDAMRRVGCIMTPLWTVDFLNHHMHGKRLKNGG